MNKIQEAIEHLKGTNRYLESENDIYAHRCIELNNIAIQALVENLERSEGCEYCHLKWGTCDAVTNRFCDMGKINYCPMCGRKLDPNE